MVDFCFCYLFDQYVLKEIYYLGSNISPSALRARVPYMPRSSIEKRPFVANVRIFYLKDVQRFRLILLSFARTLHYLVGGPDNVGLKASTNARPGAAYVIPAEIDHEKALVRGKCEIR